ncbi:sigma factor [Dactylosporangium sp. CS-047395]|uniref:sigma factor n=1 Tax=Dactylosporangium sp. CS-047395 TaxID=3239936 RepID=UPI003D94E2A9
MTPEQSYREYVAGNLERLRRTAFLLCGDWHTADDLASTVLVKLYRHWRRVARFDCEDIDGSPRSLGLTRASTGRNVRALSLICRPRLRGDALPPDRPTCLNRGLAANKAPSQS